MEQAIVIPEILDVIFSYNRREQNARCARVSRAWSDAALSHVWRVDPPLKALLQLLAPLVPSNGLRQTNKSNLVFSCVIRPADWQRFNENAKHIRKFVLNSYEMDGIADSVFTGVSMTRPTMSVLPYLEKLRVVGEPSAFQTQFLCLFFHESLSSFHLRTWKFPGMSEEMQSMLDEILCRSPNVTEIDLSFGRLPIKNIESALCLLLSGLRHLETVRLSSSLLTTAVVHSIARLPKLSTFVASSGGSLSQENVDFQLPDFDNAFASLESLTLQCDLNVIVRLFSLRTMPLRLRSFLIEVFCENRASDFRPCLASLARSCPELTKLKFIIYPETRTTSDPDPQSVTARDLYPLMSFPLLETLKLRLREPIDVSDDELITILKRCSSLRRLDLNSVPASAASKSTSLTLAFLALLAKEPASANLEHLEIYLDASKTDGLPAVESRLDNMRFISFGVSPVCSPSDRVLFYLSQLIPETCLVDVTSGFEVDDVLDGDVMLERQSVWQEIGRTLPLLMEVRLDERKRWCKQAEA
ncbi:hypothetical protein M0805_000068 [Coniferiporia weirii]|nr:hypothetical protein M0805_000068 [Coniferiporia weirii]